MLRPVGMGVLAEGEIAGYTAVGELGLDGALAPVAGVLPATLGASAAARGLICPQASGGEAAWVGQLEVLGAPSLLALVNHFKGTEVLSPPEPLLEARLPGLVPPLDAAAALEVGMIASVAGLLREGRLAQQAPVSRPAPLGLAPGHGWRRHPG